MRRRSFDQPDVNGIIEKKLFNYIGFIDHGIYCKIRIKFLEAFDHSRENVGAQCHAGTQFQSSGGIPSGNVLFHLIKKGDNVKGITVESASTFCGINMPVQSSSSSRMARLTEG